MSIDGPPSRPRTVRRRAGGACGRVRGVTLVEMLVSMVILGFVLALVAQAMHQVSQLVRAADATTRAMARSWSAGWTLLPALSNLVIPGEEGAAAFEGRPERLRGFTTQPLTGDDFGVQELRLTLRTDRGDGSTTEVLTTPTDARTGAAAGETVARLSGRVEFAYVDRTGALSKIWPPETSDTAGAPVPVLPAAIVLRDTISGHTLLWCTLEGETLKPPPAARPFWETP